MTQANTIEMIPLRNLAPSNQNPRKAMDEKAITGLAQSIKTDGLLQNLVAARPEGRKRKYPIISGERRYRALSYLVEQGDLPQDLNVPVDVREGLREDETLRIATVENIQREDLSPLEEAEAIRVLAHGGDKLDEITAQTGLSESTLKRRLALLELSDKAKEALSAGDIKVSQAEALSLGSHEDQDDLLPRITDGWYDSADEIRESIIGERPSVAMAVFDRSKYSGSYTSDLLAEDKTTYFDDTEQFFELQKAAAEKLVAEFEKENDWAELEEGYFSSIGYREAKKGESGGVVVSLTPEGKVEVHKGLIRSNVDQSVSNAVKSKPKATYARPVLEYLAMHKSAAVQAELLKNPRKAKEVGVAHMLYRADTHVCLSYLFKQDEDCKTLKDINAEAGEVLKLFGSNEGDVTDIRCFAHSPQKAFALIQDLSEEQLERVFVFLSAIAFGQDTSFSNCGNTRQYSLDTNPESLFNRVAADLGVDMRSYWKPDLWFLTRRTMDQLGGILKQSGLSRLYGNGKGYKKSELVPLMVKYFTKVREMSKPKAEQKQARDWLPEALHFPAIDPDAPEQANEDQASKAA